MQKIFLYIMQAACYGINEGAKAHLYYLF